MVKTSSVMPAKKKTPKIRRGSAVAFTLGATRVKAIVIEDPRPLGPDGANVLRIRADFRDGVEPLECNILESDVKAIPVRRRRAA